MDVRDRYNKVFAAGTTTERLVYFSDAVFAIAMTLLVIDLRVPVPGDESTWEIISSQADDLFAYALSFLIIGLNWLGHHRKFRVIKSHDGPLMWLDLLLLFFIAFLPFPTSLLSEYGGDVIAVVFYAAIVGIIGMIQYFLWRYAWRKGFVDAVIDAALYKYVRRNQLLTPIVFGVSIPIAIFVSGDVAMYFWLGLIPVHIALRLWDARTPSAPRKAANLQARQSPD